MGILLNTARNAANDGLLSTREVGKLLSKALEDGRVSRGETEDLKKIRTELYNELTPEARRAINSFLSLGGSFSTDLASNIFGVSDEQIDGLERADVRSAQQLLVQSRTAEDRERVAGLANLDQIMVTSLAEKVDLARVLGIGPKYAAVLHGVGINDVKELSQQNAVALRQSITSYLNTTDGRAITSRRPSLDSVKKWIDAAKTMPRMIRRQGDTGADFGKAAFDALANTEKGMLLWGFDVRLDDGFVFDADQITASNVSQPSGAIKAKLDELTTSVFLDEYESAELAYLEEVKVDDEVIGYRATFDVTGHDTIDSELAAYEGGAGGDITTYGTVEMTFDAEANEITRDDYMDWGHSEHMPHE